MRCLKASIPCLLALLPACAPVEGDTAEPSLPADELVLPDISGIDMEAAFTDAMNRALDVRLGAAWTGHLATLGMTQPGCPDMWVGAPDDDALDLDMDAPGTSWSDHCATGDGVGFEGSLYWESAASGEGDPASEEGATLSGSRMLVGDALVGDGSDARLEFDGTGSDAMTISEADGYSRWTWSSLVQATVTGSEVWGTNAPDGLRTDLYVYATGGDADTLEARGNVYYFTDRISERFDSIAMDLDMIGTLGAGPTDCTSEPYGWLSLRDEDAYWYDLVFLPKDSMDATDTASNDDPYDVCDGCGTFYVRGVETGTLCPDLSSVWDGRLSAPPIDDFVPPLRDLP